MDTTNPLILIIEDDRILSKMYSEKFTIDGFSVLTAGDGETGLQMAMDAKPACILLDMMLPKKDGTLVLQKLRENSDTAHIPVIALTNFADKKGVDLASKYGAKDYLLKAMHSPEEVVQKVKKHITPQAPNQ